MIDFEASVDVVVAGTGVAGLTAARGLARAGLDVLVVTKAAAEDANTTWAQGGIAVVRGEPGEHDDADTVTAHVADTLVAAGGLADPAAVEAILADGPAAVARLRGTGAVFDAGPGGTLLRTREGGHHADRIIHAGGDATGAEVERALLAAPGLPAVLADHLAVDVVLDEEGSVAGILVLDPDRRWGLIRCGAVVLATGGSGQLFAATTNPAVATGDGLAMALRAGAALADAEFVQFHPTMLYTGTASAAAQRPLVTEAVRGAGAVLVDPNGERIMLGVHPLADLAPRDVVSLAITRRLAALAGTAPAGGRADHVFLDAAAIPAKTFARRFPTVTAACAAAGILPWRDPIPVAPGAHYQCGGVLTDLAGRSTVPGLYAVGEVARTGLHGANRLASNSLLEGMVMGERVIAAVEADLVAAYLRQGHHRRLPVRGTGSPVAATAMPCDPLVRPGLQAVMSRHAGIGRDAVGLTDALEAVDRMTAAAGAGIERTAGGGGLVRSDQAPTRESIEAANLVLSARALLTAARDRTESRGCHVRIDRQDSDPAQARSTTVVLRDGVLVVEPLPAGWRPGWAARRLAVAV